MVVVVVEKLNCVFFFSAHSPVCGGARVSQGCRCNLEAVVPTSILCVQGIGGSAITLMYEQTND